MANQTPIYAGGRVVGQVVGGVFRKAVKASVHFLRRPPAIAFDLDSLRAAERAGAVRVEVTDTETGKVYRALLAEVLERGFSLNRGHGAQVALVLGMWNKETAAQQMTLLEVRP